MAERTPEEVNAEQRAAAIKRMEESVPTPTPKEVDEAVMAGFQGKKKAVAAEASPTYQTRAVKAKADD